MTAIEPAALRAAGSMHSVASPRAWASGSRTATLVWWLGGGSLAFARLGSRAEPRVWWEAAGRLGFPSSGDQSVRMGDSRKASVPGSWTQRRCETGVPFTTLTTTKAQGHISWPALAKVAASSALK